MFSLFRPPLAGLHFLPFEFRNVILHQIVELQLSFIAQHHDGDCDEGLGNRSGPEHIRGLQRLFLHDAPAHRIDGRDLSIASHQGDHAGTLAKVDNCLEVPGNLG